MNKPLVLVVEDDTPVRNLITTTLKTHEYRYLSTQNGTSAVMEALSHNPDIVLLDLQLPDMDGMDFIRWFRKWNSCPVIVISRKSSHTDKVNALYAGADDYVNKPFYGEELEARIHSALRKRLPGSERICYEAEGLKIDFFKRQVTLEGAQIHFSPVEYRILECLALHSGAVVTYQMLLEKIWGPHIGSPYLFQQHLVGYDGSGMKCKTF